MPRIGPSYYGPMPDDHLTFLGNQKLIDIACAALDSYYDQSFDQEFEVDKDEFAEDMSYRLHCQCGSEMLCGLSYSESIPMLKTMISASFDSWVQDMQREDE